jgi:lipopolysaccharide transport system permease protein
MSSPAPVALPARPRLPPLRRLYELVAHLTRRDLTTTHRFTALGVAWPLARLLAQWAVLVLVFDRILTSGIRDYPVFLFCGLVAWTWFSTGLSAATGSIPGGRHLVLQPGFPALVLPPVAMAVAFADVLVALPILVVLVASTQGLAAAALFLPVLWLLQAALVTGLGWLTAALAVYLRDVPQIVGVALMLLFYVTPIFYDADRAPPGIERVLRLNPVAAIIDGWRAVLIDGRLPSAGSLAVAAIGAVLALAAGLVAFRRLEGGFADEL